MIELTLNQLLREKTKEDPKHEFMVYADRDLQKEDILCIINRETEALAHGLRYC